jgi:hypothetical protein
MNEIKPIQIYLKTFLTSLILDWLLLLSICNALGFDRKSAICVYLYGIGGFLLKGIVFFTPLLFIRKQIFLDSKPKRVLLFLSPFLLFLVWFVLIIIFRIELLYPDLSFGYISRFPHFYIQLLSALIIPLIILWRTNKKIKTNANTM